MFRNLFKKKVKKIGIRLIQISNHQEKHNIQSLRVKPWFELQGDKTLRLDYPLNESSIVFDLGGYRGDWTSDILNKYACKVHIFEPYQKYCEEIKVRFSTNPKISIYNFGLGGSENTLFLNISDDSSSVYKLSENKVEISIKSIFSFLDENYIKHIDLIKINIEGGEYELLEALVENSFIKKIKNIQVQFHDFVPNAKDRMNAIQIKLAKTHQITYQFEFVWENWCLRSDL